jgi:hypothetical protein
MKTMIPCEQTYVPLAKDRIRKHTSASDPNRKRAFALLNKGTDYQKSELVGFACRAVADDYDEGRFAETLDELELPSCWDLLHPGLKA